VVTSVEPDRNPYVGARPFERGETLYGRGKEIAQLLDRVVPSRIVLMYSPSGAGKTSLIQAGLMPRLEDADFVIRPVIRVGRPACTPPAGENGNRYLVSMLTCLDPELCATRLLELARMPLRDCLNGLRAGEGEHELLIFDQFEEILLDPTDRPAKEEFIAQLGEALRDRWRWALFAMREDRIAGLDPYLHLLPTRLAARYRLDLLTRQAALEAVQGPARERGVTFAREAADELVGNLSRVQVQTPQGPKPNSGDYVEPVQLQVVCQRLWELNDRVAGSIDTAAVRNFGHVDRALGDYYEENIAEVVRETGVREQALRDWFDDELITRQGFRAQVPHGPAVDGDLDGEAIARRLEPYLVRSEPQRGTNWWELTHDRLIEPVRARNHAWRENNRSLLERQAVLWHDNSRDNGYLLRGGLLVEAERQRDLKAGRLTPVERKFLDACRRFAEHEDRITRQRNRWLAGLAAALAAALAIAAGLAFYANDRREAMSVQRDEAQINLLLLRAEALRETQPIDALRRGIAALELSDTPRTRAALVATLVANRYAGLLPHPGTVNAIAFSADGRTVMTGNMTGDKEGSTILWDLTNPARPSRQARLEGRTETGAFAPNGRAAVTCSGNRAVVWDLTDPARPIQRSTLTGHTGPLSAVVYSPDGRTVLAGSDDGSAVLWDVTDPDHPIRRGSLDNAGVDAVTAMAFGPDGRTAMTAGGDLAVVWDLTDPARPIRRSTLSGLTAAITAVAYGPDGHSVLTGGNDNKAILWDLTDTAHPSPTVTLGGHGEFVSAVAFAPDGRSVLVGSADRKVALWDISNPRVPVQRATLIGHAGPVTAVAFAPDGRTVLTGGGDGRAILWEATESRGARRLSALTGSKGALSAVAYALDGRSALTGSADSTARLWDLTDRARPVLLTEMAGHTGPVTAVAFAPDGRRALTGSADSTARLWDLTDRARPVLLTEMAGHTGPVTAVAFAPNGKTAITTSNDGKAVVHGAANPSQSWSRDLRDPESLSGDILSSVAYSPDGRAALTGGFDKTAKLWNLGPPAKATPLRGHTGPVTAVAFAPDGSTALTAGIDRTARLWSLNDPTHPTLRATLIGHAGPVRAAAFGSDGGTSIIAITGGDDGAILWDATDPDHPGRLLDLTGHDGAVRAVALSPDGHTALTAGEDMTAIVWDISPTLDMLAHPQRYACAIAGFGLSPQEWEKDIKGVAYRDACRQ